MALELPKFTKKEKAPSDKPSVTLKVAQFFEKNPIMKILIPVILFLIIVVIFILVIFGDGILMDKDDDASVDSSNQSNEVLVIPEDDIIKDKEIVELIDNDPLSPDILASAKYTGSVVGSSAEAQGSSNRHPIVHPWRMCGRSNAFAASEPSKQPCAWFHTRRPGTRCEIAPSSTVSVSGTEWS
jgi:hypothetical protein